MTQDELKARTKTLGLRALNLVDSLPTTVKGRTIASQLARAATGVGANYRAACCARSKAEFIAKIGNVVEEADETAYWLEIVIDGKVLDSGRVQSLLDEANEIVAIMVAARKTAQRNSK